MTVDPPLLLAQLGRICSGNSSDSYVSLSSPQVKVRSTVTRERLLFELKKSMDKVTRLVEASIIAHILLAFLTLHPPTIVFWHYLGSPTDQNTSISGKAPDDDVQDSLNFCLTFLTLSILVLAYLLTCWNSYQGIRRFSWAFLIMNAINILNIIIETRSLELVFSRAVILCFRTLVFLFNILAVFMGFKLVRAYAELIEQDKAVATDDDDIELQQYRETPRTQRRLGVLHIPNFE